jgi:hypothetical protein
VAPYSMARRICAATPYWRPRDARTPSTAWQKKVLCLHWHYLGENSSIFCAITDRTPRSRISLVPSPPQCRSRRLNAKRCSGCYVPIKRRNTTVSVPTFFSCWPMAIPLLKWHAVWEPAEERYGCGVVTG